MLGGGRYDGLAEALGLEEIPAPGIGFSIGYDLAGDERGTGASGKPQTGLGHLYSSARSGGLFCGTRCKSRKACDRRAVRLNLGLDGKLKRSLELANKLSARFALIVGENEIAAGRYALKNMQSGDQQTVTREELIQRIK